MKIIHYSKKRRQLKCLVRQLKQHLSGKRELTNKKVEILIQKIRKKASEFPRNIDFRLRRRMTSLLAFSIFGIVSSHAQNFAPKVEVPYGNNEIIKPYFVDINGDGDLDLFGLNASAYGFRYYENIGNQNNPQFANSVFNPFGITIPGVIRGADFVDIDGDDDFDIIVDQRVPNSQVGSYPYSSIDEDLYIIENIGTIFSPQFAGRQLLSVFTNNNSNPDIFINHFQPDIDYYQEGENRTGKFKFVDIDNDGDYDLLTSVDWDESYDSYGSYNNFFAYHSTMRFYENIGTADAPQFIDYVTSPFGVGAALDDFYQGIYDNLAEGYFIENIDMDNDGDDDLLLASQETSTMRWLENIGNQSNPSFDWPGIFFEHETGSNDIEFADLDGDGDLDLFMGTGGNSPKLYYRENLSSGGDYNIYVDINATGDNNGTSWDNAYTDLQDAVSTDIGASQYIIHVAEGIYYPTVQSPWAMRGKSFEISSNTQILGGYPSGGGTRNPNLQIVNLSGEIDGISGYDGNSYHVVKVQDADNVSIEGITIKEGSADNENSFGRSRGGGLYIIGSEVDLKEVKVRWNKAIYGGGLFASVTSNVTMNNGDFKNNRADYGSAIYHSFETELYIHNTKIENNVAVVRCAMEVNNSSYTLLSNSLIANNQSTNANGIALIATNRDQTFEVENSTILGGDLNKALVTLQIGNNDELNASFKNSIIAHQTLSFDKAFKVYNFGTLNLDTEHCFIQGDNVSGNSQNNLYSDTAGDLLLNGNYSLNPCSPAVDMGNDLYVNQNEDIIGNPRLFNTVDIGAFESQVVCVPRMKGDNEIFPVKVFPNPTNGKLVVEIEEDDIAIRIYNILGEEMLYTTELENDISRYPAGIYILIIEQKGRIIHNEKIIKR